MPRIIVSAEHREMAFRLLMASFDLIALRWPKLPKVKVKLIWKKLKGLRQLKQKVGPKLMKFLAGLAASGVVLSQLSHDKMVESARKMGLDLNAEELYHLAHTIEEMLHHLHVADKRSQRQRTLALRLARLASEILEDDEWDGSAI